ncbi:hypothetical protein EDC01DRAFT_722007 [Geopyxis carbonaria]|nr:hypothetical protein EDC01DRAFT_722007 [Geopyxis carbonaria]
MTALPRDHPTMPPNLTLTENGAPTHESTLSPLLDLFVELERSIAPARLRALLDAAWAVAPLDTLKVVWNARSIHAGKADRELWYRCVGWLREAHPRTLLENLEWVVRPVIPKKMAKAPAAAAAAAAAADDDVMVLDEADTDLAEEEVYDIANGLSHGYYGDLVNILVLAVKGELRAEADPKAALYTQRPASASERRHEAERAAHDNLIERFEDDAFYRALHLRVAQIFAAQLARDAAALDSGDRRRVARISLAAKWAPSLEKMHDRATFVASSIAELLFRPEAIGQADASRTVYLQHARQRYRQLLARLRAALDVVEIKVSMQRFADIHYERVPSLAMDRYQTLFMAQDLAHFEAYIAAVAAGRTQISGAVLSPAKMVRAALSAPSAPPPGKKSVKDMIAARLHALNADVQDAQWNTLVRRLRQSGTLSNALAVVDVSGSMRSPRFADRTKPLHSALGLGLLLARLAAPPFTNCLVTFSVAPQLVPINPAHGFRASLDAMNTLDWDMNTDFVAVFRDLLLPEAVARGVPRDQMVKRLFVFSDMQFDQAMTAEARWDATSYETVKALYEAAGYDVPELVFWNLAAREGRGKVVTADTPGTALVSGYSQGMLKVFLENGGFEAVEEEGEEEVVLVGGDGEEVVVKRGLDPLSTVKSAIGHESYAMLKVVD